MDSWQVTHNIILFIIQSQAPFPKDRAWQVDRTRVRLACKLPQVGSLRPAHSFVETWSWKHFYGHSPSSTDSRRAVIMYWRKNVHWVLVNCLGGLPRNSVVRITDRTRNDIKCVEGPGRKTEIKQTNSSQVYLPSCFPSDSPHSTSHIDLHLSSDETINRGSLLMTYFVSGTLNSNTTTTTIWEAFVLYSGQGFSRFS